MDTKEQAGITASEPENPTEGGSERISEHKILSAIRKGIEASNIVSMTDAAGNITYANDEFCRISEYSRKELIGQNHRIIRHPDMPKKVFEDLWTTISSGKIWKWLVKNRKKHGGAYWVKTVIVPICGKDGNISEYVSIRTDVTDLEHAKEKLSRSLKKLEDLDQRRSDFIKIASHELRTPVTVIRGYASMLEESFRGKSDSESRECAAAILENADRLIRIINDMLELSKMDFEEIHFDREFRSLSDVLREVTSEVLEQAEGRGISLKVRNSPPAETTFDFPKIRRAVFELVTNALKFTPSKGTITCGTFEDDKHCGIFVRDTGIGMREEDTEKIFERFIQLQNPLTRATSGTGLGLSLVKEIAERSGGSVEVKSDL